MRWQIHKQEEEDPECTHTGHCEATPYVDGLSSCTHCGAEMCRIDGSWYHWSQVNPDGTLIPGSRAQWEAKR